MLLDDARSMLGSYMGKSPCPNDINEFWDKAVRELDAHNPNATLTKVWDLPNAECFDLFFEGIGGARVHASYARPKNTTAPCKTILMFHGYRANFREWNRLLFFVGQGFCVAALEVRGQSGLSDDNHTVSGFTQSGHIIRGAVEGDPNKLFYKNVFLDTATLCRIVAKFPEVDEKQIFSFGGSQGGALALVAASLEPSITKTLAYCPFLSDYKRSWELDGIAYNEISTYFSFADPTHETEEAFFNTLSYIDIKNLVGRIKGQVKMATGLKDASCPPETQFAVYNHIVSKKDIILYPEHDHADFPGIFDAALKWFLE